MFLLTIFFCLVSNFLFSGQVSFPGGKTDKTDVDIIDTALRHHRFVLFIYLIHSLFLIIVRQETKCGMIKLPFTR